ncbi:Ig-like domain-containing protein [Pseudarthrobacter sp. Y6]|uniref:Ig-like domain-containing protein n=1 Tax=Pseudarthrobacter sp. Y6 TaxID=3418422 RepID=UPI003CF836E8
MNREEPGSARDSSWWDPLFSADGWALFVASTLSRLYLGVVLSLALIAVLPALLGWHGTVVQSGSMEPHISAGDVVLAAAFGSDQRVPVGGVMEFTSPAEAEPSGVEKTRLHRIVAENPDGSFVTAGDANAEVDSIPLERGQITGQGRLLVPSIGLPGLWLGLGNLPGLALWSVLTLLAVVAALFGGRPAGQAEQTDDGGTPPPAHRTKSHRTRSHRSNSLRLRAGSALGLVAALAALVIAGATVFSSAAFTASTANAANTFGTAADWNPPSVSLANPEATVKGAVVLTADASDAESGLRSVTIEYQRAGASTWTVLCTPAAQPYTCNWNTASVTDGSYSLRAVATDNAGFTTTSAIVETRVANTFAVVNADPGEIRRGTVSLSTILFNPPGLISAVRVEYSVAGANKWNTLCLNLIAPYNCSWATGAFANGEYDLRAVALSGLSSTYSETVAGVLVDNAAPTASMVDPGTPLSGTRTFTATATDAHSGIAQVQIQYARTGTSTWLPLCTADVEPHSCRFDTTSLTSTSASYSFRAVATDAAGNSTLSAAVTRVVDNTVSSVSVENPGAYLTGTVTLNAAANSTAGVGSVRIQAAPAGTTTWTTRCTLAVAPFSCAWNTSTVPDGLYDVRAILTDGAGKQTISATVTGRRVDNSPLRAADIQAANGSGAVGKMDAGDALSFTYSQQVNLATVTPGWAGAPLPVTVRLRDGNVSGLGLGNNGDTLDIQRPGSTVNLGAVNTKSNFVKNKKTVTLNATMTATTVTAGGVPRTVVTVMLGSVASGGGSLWTSSTAVAMVWSTTASVATSAGVASSTAPATETGTLDRDF